MLIFMIIKCNFLVFFERVSCDHLSGIMNFFTLSANVENFYVTLNILEVIKQVIEFIRVHG